MHLLDELLLLLLLLLLLSLLLLLLLLLLSLLLLLLLLLSLLLLLLLLLWLCYSLSIFHTNICWWSFTGVSETASILTYSGLFSVFWLILIVVMVSSCSLIFNSSSPFNKSSGIVPSAPITTGITVTVTFMFHCFLFFFTFHASSRYLSLLAFFLFYSAFCRYSEKFSSFLFFLWLSLSLVFWPGFIIIILLIRQFFPPALSDSFPLKSERQQVSSSIQDSS